MSKEKIKLLIALAKEELKNISMADSNDVRKMCITNASSYLDDALKELEE